MVNVTFKSNIQEVSKKLAKDIKQRESAKQIALGEIAKLAFKEMESKYLVPGDNADGDRYKPVSRGDLSRFQKTRAGQKKLSVGKYFDSKKIISRSGDLLSSIIDLAKGNYQERGTVRTDNYMVKITRNKIEIWATSTKAIVLELKRAGNKSARSILKKTFKTAIKIFNKAFLKAIK